MGALAGGKEVEDTATGNPLTFLTDLAKPLRSVLATWQPHQSGSGDPSPSNVRPVVGMDGVNVWHTGKNLLPNDEVKAEGNQFFLCASSSNYPFHLVPGKYTLSTTGKTAFAYYKKQGGSGVLIHGNAVNYGTFTITDGGNYQIWYYTSGATAEDFTDIQLEVGESATTYEAPQVGTSYSVAFPATGKNLLTGTPYGGVFFNVEAGTDFAKSTVHATYTESGNETTVTTDSRYGCVFATGMLSPGTYNIHTETSEANCRFSAYVTDADLITKERKAITANNISVTLTESARIAVVITNSSSGSVVATNVQVESGSSYTSWEPYTATVYGGSLDLTTGVLTAEYAVISKKWSDFGSRNVMESTTRGAVSITSNPSTSGGAGALCNIATRKWDYSIDSLHFYTDGNYAFLFLPNGTEESTDVQIAYPLATPQTFQLSPTQITALIGNNTMWADADSLSVTYLKKG